MTFSLYALISVAFALVTTTAATCLTNSPPTVYEDAVISPQNGDFDATNNRFPAHSGWYNDNLIHYYKFRMYTPGTYPIASVAGEIPTGRLFLTTLDGGFSGVVGNPIAEVHHDDGESYSDFVEIVFVDVDPTYVADTYTSYEDIVADAASTTPSGIFANFPLVPVGSSLEDPNNLGSDAPISAITVWYRCVQVQAFVFEVTDQSAADFWASTRTSSSADYAISVDNFMAGARPFAIPLWHVNQYETGVTTGVNNGGPSPAGMRNVIASDRGDAGYSPLWRIYWVTEAPVDFTADQASHPNQFTTENGFEIAITPMYVNCPNIGAVGPMNTNKASSFNHPAVLESGMTYTFSGALVMEGGVAVSFNQGGSELASTTTSPMGFYSFAVASASLGATFPEAIDGRDGSVVATFELAQSQSCLTDVPATVYEDSVLSPQNMDFDVANNRFPAHSGWYNDNLIHYYKFRMYTPMTYPVASVAGEIPTGRLFLTTTDGGFSGVVGNPIAEFHTQDGESYSDFVEIVFVDVDATYVADTYTSLADIDASGATHTASGIYANFPIVPTGSVLEDPANYGSNAPISGVTVWYRCQMVQAFVFEVTAQSAADFWAGTRTSSSADYAISVDNFMAGARPFAIPLWHVNQYETGVTTGVNNGGPSPAGMRNVIASDRGDAGYSPLWRIYWITEAPVDFTADQASHPNQFTSANGFELAITPMYVNCPNIGAVGPMNMNKASSFNHPAVLESGMTHTFSGSLVMEGGVTVALNSGGADLATTSSSPMGFYSFAISADSVMGALTAWDTRGNTLIATFETAAVAVSDILASSAPVWIQCAMDSDCPENMVCGDVSGVCIEDSGIVDSNAVDFLTTSLFLAFLQ